MNESNNSSDRFYYSWPEIIFSLYIFFPLGLYLIIKKATLHRKNVFVTGNETLSIGVGLIIFGILFLILGAVFSSINYFDDTTNYIVRFFSIFGNFFGCLGAVVVFISFFQRARSKKYQRYIYLIVNLNVEDINKIAMDMKLSYNTVVNDLEIMINKRFLEKYVIDYNNNTIINSEKKKIEQEENNKYTRVVRCPNCHANNLLSEKIGKCAYCKSYIE